MAEQQLKLKIGADVAQGVAGVKQVGAALGDLNSKTTKAQSGFKDLSLTVETLRAGILARKEFIITETDLNKIAKYNKEISSLESVLRQVQNTGKEGFWGGKPIEQLSNSTTGATKGVAALQASFSNLLAPLSKAYSGIRILANILPGIGIAGIIGFAVGPIIDFAKSLFGVDEAAQKAGTGIKIFRDVVAESAAEIASSGVANLTKLSAALTDTVLPINQRKAALEEYNKVADKQNQLAVTDLGNINKINEAIGNQIGLLKTRALIKGAEDQIAALFKTIFTNEFKLSNAADKFNKQFDLSQLAAGAGDVKAFTQEIGKLNDASKVLGVQQTGFLDAQIAATQRKVGELFGFIQRTAEKGSVFGSVFDITDDKKEKVKKKIKETFHFAAPIEPTIFNAPAIRKKVGEAFDRKPALLPVEPDLHVQKLFLDLINSAAALKKAGNKLGDGVGDAFVEVFDKKIQKAVESGMSTKDLEKFQEKLKEIMGAGAELANVLGNAFGAFGQALVQGQNAMQAFLSSVKNSLAQLFGQLLKTVAVAAILSLITGGVGGGGFSFVGALKGLLGVKPFAKGGLAFGPTLGMVGEGKNISRSNPEVISPLSDLKKFIGGGSQFPNYLPAWELSGDTLRMWYARSNKSGRAFG